MISIGEARVIAENFGRQNIPEWERWGCVVREAESLGLPGYFTFIYPPGNVGRDGKPIRLGGNFPILVDRETGEPRFVKGRAEYLLMKRNSS